MKATLCLTHKCNMACSYCYAGYSTKPDMLLSTAIRCVDFAFDNVPDGQKLGLCLFGGEPLLRFDLVRQVTRYACQIAPQAGKEIQISITTNGTLIDENIIAFAADYNIHLCFSIDGPPHVHNRNRLYRNGNGSFKTVMKNLELAMKRLSNVQVNAVFGPDTINDLPGCLQFFADSGIPAIHFNPDITASWPDTLCAMLPDIYDRIAGCYTESYRQGREIAVNLLDAKMLLFIKGGYALSDRCSMGDGEWAFAPSGNIYPCERFVGKDEDTAYLLGNIHAGLDARRRCALRAERGNHDPHCFDCALQKYCMNWCGCTNYFLSGRADMSAPILCAMEEAAIRASRSVFSTLVEANNELFMDHLYNYVNAEFHHR